MAQRLNPEQRAARLAVLERHGWNAAAAARELGLSNSSVLTKWLWRLGPDIPQDVIWRCIGRYRRSRAPGQYKRAPDGHRLAGYLAAQRIAVLEKHRWNMNRAAKELDVDRSALIKWVRRQGIDYRAWRPGRPFQPNAAVPPKGEP